MSDMGDAFRAMREDGKTKRAARRQQAARRLLVVGIAFESKNGGAHLIVGRGRDFDFWPGTGKWCNRRASGDHGRGVESLIERVKRDQQEGQK